MRRRVSSCPFPSVLRFQLSRRTCDNFSLPQAFTNRFGKLERCLMRTCQDTEPHGANLTSTRRSPTVSTRSIVLQGEIHEADGDGVQTNQFRETVGSFTLKKIFDACVSSRTLMQSLHSSTIFTFCVIMLAAVGDGMAGAQDGCSVSEAAGSIRHS